MNDKVANYIARRKVELGARIRTVRSERGWTQEQAARFLKCLPRRINRVEQGIAELGVAEIELLSKAMGVLVADILQRSQ